ncbi:hypothetical protein R6Q57_009761 [Mikania cordata]
MFHDHIDRAANLGSKLITTVIWQKLEWIGDNGVKIITGPVPAIRFEEERRVKTWFNNLTGPVNGEDKIFDEATCVELGNGEAVADDAMEDCWRYLEEECVAVAWKKGDVMVVDNLMVLHSRRPLLKAPRRILASLCK